MKIPGITPQPWISSNGNIKKDSQQAEGSSRGASIKNAQPYSPLKEKKIAFGGEKSPSSERNLSFTSVFTPIRGAQTINSVRSIASTAEAQRRVDKENGIGLFEGAKEFARLLSEGVDAVSTIALNTGTTPTKDDIIKLLERYEKAGQAGQTALLTNFANESAQLINKHILSNSTLANAAEKLGSVGGAEVGKLATVGSEVTAAASVGSNTATAANAAVKASTVAGAEAAAGAGATTSSAGAAATGSKLLGLIGGIYSGYQLISNWGKTDVVTGAINGVAAGAYVGSLFPGFGTVIGGVVGGLVGVASGLFRSSGKGADQKMRDQLRKGLQELGLVDSNFKVRLADGSLYDIGRDGKAKLKNADGSSRPVYNTDPSNPLTAQAIGLVNPLAQLLAGENPKAASDLSGMLTNAVMSNAGDLETVRQNVLKLVGDLGLTEENFKGLLTGYFQAGDLKQSEYAAYLNGVTTLFNPEALAAQAPELYPAVESVNESTIELADYDIDPTEGDAPTVDESPNAAHTYEEQLLSA